MRFSFIFLILILSEPTFSQEYTPKWTIEATTSFRVTKHENQKGFGALLSRNIKGNWWLQSGLIYKNQKEKFESEITSDYYTLTYDTELRLDYISIPLMLMYNINFVNLGLGTNYERFLNSTDLSDNPLVETSLSPGDKNKWYLTGYIGYPISIINNIQLEPGMLFNYANEKIFTDVNLSFKYKF